MRRLLWVSVFILLFASLSFGKQITVGVYLSLTGSIAAWGRIELQGIRVAKMMNPSVGGNRIKLLVLDVGSKPEGAALVAERFAYKGVKFVIGPVATPMALAALPILEKNRIVDVIPTANSVGLVEKRPFASRVCFTNRIQAKILADYIYSDRLKRGVIIRDTCTEYSLDLAKRFKNDFEKEGGTIIRIYDIHSDQKDFTPIVTDIKKVNPDFIFFTNYYNTIALFLRQMREMGLKQKVFAGSAASSHALLKIAGKYANGLIFADDFDPLIPQGKLSKRFIELFKKTYHRLPDSPEALAGDAYLLLMKGFEKAGFKPQAVAHFVRNTTFYGITGKIVIKNGSVNRTVVLRKVEHGRFIPVALYEP